MLFQIIGMAILAVFYGGYFMKMTLQKRKGIKTSHMGEGKTGFPRFIELALTAAACTVSVVEVISILIANTARIPLGVRIAGGCLGLAGVAVFLLSLATMRDSWRAGVSEDEKTELITSGIYGISRNPAFLGFDLVYIGILLMFFNRALLWASLVAMLLLHLQIVNVEEDHLLMAFGDDYMRYKKKVRRYIGRKR